MTQSFIANPEQSALTIGVITVTDLNGSFTLTFSFSTLEESESICDTQTIECSKAGIDYTGWIFSLLWENACNTKCCLFTDYTSNIKNNKLLDITFEINKQYHHWNNKIKLIGVTGSKKELIYRGVCYIG